MLCASNVGIFQGVLNFYKENTGMGRIWKELWDTDAYDRTLTLQDLAWATLNTDGTAIVCREKRLSYQEFHRITTGIACCLMDQGLKKGDVVAIHMHRDECLLCAMFGVIKAGAAYLILNTDWPGQRISYVISDSGTRFVITDQAAGDYAGAVTVSYSEMIRESSPCKQDLNPGPQKEAVSYLRRRMLCPEASDVAALYYTSGSTGKPKGVVLSHANMVDSTLPLKSNACIREGAMSCASILDVVNTGFMASVLTYGSSLYTGGKHVLVQNEDLEQLIPVVDIMREEKVDFILMTPSVMTTLLTVQDFVRQLQNVKEITLCGEPFSQQLANTLTGYTKEGTIINNLYGTTEAAVGLAGVNVRGRKVTMGLPFANTQVFAQDPDGNRLPDGESGELCVKGLRVAIGYKNRPELTDEKFYTDTDGIKVYRTGDFGFINRDGEIEFLGRNDRMVKLGGVRFELPEVEYYLLQQPYISEAAVKVCNIGGRDQLCAVIVSDENVAWEKIRMDLEKVIPKAMIPTVYNRVDAMPTTERGKIDYDRLVIVPPDLPRDYESPVDDMEEMVCSIFAEGLDIERVEPGTNFFELGGSSLKAFIVLSLLNQKGYSISMGDLLKASTPRALAKVLRRQNAELDQGSSVSEEENITEENSGKNNSPDVNIQVPGEFLELSKDENTLAILPVMNSTMAFLFMKRQGVTDRQNTIRVRFVIKGFCPEEEFNRRIRNLFCNHPALRSSFARAGNGRYWQIFYKRKTPTVYYRDLRGLSDAASGRILSGFWQVMAESGNTFEAGCFPLPNGNTTLLIQAEHTIIDGLSLQIIQNELLSSGTGDIHEDALLRYRQRQILAAKSIPEDVIAYFKPEYPMAKSKESLYYTGKSTKEVIRLSEKETDSLIKRCSLLGVTMFCYVLHSYGKVLLSLLRRNEVWLLHTDSGRSPSDKSSFSIVSNMMTGIPVRITSDMTSAQLQADILYLAGIQGLSDSDLFYRQDFFGIYEGIVSEDFGTADPQILESEILGGDNLRGNRMSVKDGCLNIAFYHEDNSEQNAFYRNVKALMLQDFTLPPDP